MNDNVKAKAKEMVCDQIIAMYQNNNGYQHEGFEAWCEDGDVFALQAECIVDAGLLDECVKVMKKVAPFVDKLTQEIVGEE